MLRLNPSLSTCITDTGRIIAFRNRLIHAYASIADEVVWGILEKNLPRLQQEVEALRRLLTLGGAEGAEASGAIEMRLQRQRSVQMDNVRFG
jgi:hypothetical protein